MNTTLWESFGIFHAWADAFIIAVALARWNINQATKKREQRRKHINLRG